MATNPTDTSNHYDPRILKGKDSFFTTTYRFFDGLGKHTTALVVLLGVLVVLGIAGGLMANRHEVKSEEGKNALFLAQKSYDTEIKALAGVPPVSAATAAPKDVKDATKDAAKDAKAKGDAEAAAAKRVEDLSYQKFDVDAKLPEAVKEYQAVIAQYPGTRPAHEARMALGDLYFNHGDAAKALPLYKDAVNSAPGNFEKALALSAVGYANENAGKPSDAVASFEKALNLGEGSIKGDVLLAIARCHEALHDTAKARSTYDQIISQLPNTDSAKSAEAFKAKL